jgi:hypothetical protein
VTARFGKYEILYELKSGGMGSVLLGRKRGPGAFEQLVAIKTIRPDYAKAETVRAMFLDEAAILARLNHPGIATVHDFGEDGGTLYMVMEYVAGIAMRDLHELPPMIAARAIAEAGRGLHAAHEARDPSGTPLGLVHRDISPDNLMVGYDGHVKVIDFGIALVKNRQAPVTEFGTVKGKPPYMSPEQVKNEPMDRRSDVFSLGIVTWEMIVGRSLFEGDSLYAIALAVEQQALVPPSRALGTSLPTGLDAAVMGALERDPERRTPTAAAFAEALEGVVQASGGESLAGWAERELETKRSEHRAWLAKIVGGTPLPRAKGRASGLQTEVGAVAPPAPLAQVDPIAETSLGPAERASAPPRRSIAPLVVVSVAVLVTAIAIYLATAGRHHDQPIAKATPPGDAAVPVITAAPRDASVSISITADAAVAIVADAAPAHAIHHGHHDAGVVAVARPIDAAPVGEGIVDLRFKAGQAYANASIDGGNSFPLPEHKKRLAAGHHVIRFFEPTSGNLLDTQSIELGDGQTLIVIQH